METFSGGSKTHSWGLNPVPFGRRPRRTWTLKTHSHDLPFFGSQTLIHFIGLDCKADVNQQKKTQIAWKKGQMLKTNRTTPPLLEKTTNMILENKSVDVVMEFWE